LAICGELSQQHSKDTDNVTVKNLIDQAKKAIYTFPKIHNNK